MYGKHKADGDRDEDKDEDGEKGELVMEKMSMTTASRRRRRRRRRRTLKRMSLIAQRVGRRGEERGLWVELSRQKRPPQKAALADRKKN